MTRATYIHGTDPDEQARLAQLNALTNRAFLEFLNVPTGGLVLEVGSGLGILAAAVQDAGAVVVGVEYAWPQLDGAKRRRHHSARAPHLVQGDAHHLPVGEGLFDLVYARYVLEHVHDPARVLAEMTRVVRPGGTVAVLENDISLVRFDPPCPAFDRAWAAFGTLQRRLGGDGTIGRRLFRLLHGAGLTRVELSFQPEAHWQGSPGFAPWVRNIIGNVESGRDALVESGLCTQALVDEAVAELDALVARPDASAGFVWNRARGVRPPDAHTSG
jgi:ubiquinone/menaquinone biosynthesis C-methylase UbiE